MNTVDDNSIKLFFLMDIKPIIVKSAIELKDIYIGLVSESIKQYDDSIEYEFKKDVFSYEIEFVKDFYENIFDYSFFKKYQKLVNRHILVDEDDQVTVNFDNINLLTFNNISQVEL